MAESPERAAQWEAAAIGDEVELFGPDHAGACAALSDDSVAEPLLCTRDASHSGRHVATGSGVVLAAWS